MLLLPLIRTLPTDDGVFGHILYKDYHWHTLEPELPRVGNKGCIPSGIYQCSWDTKGKIIGYLLDKVYGFENVQIHIGNDELDTQGCILLGKRRGIDKRNKYAVLDSRDAIDEFHKILKKQSFILDISQRFSD